MPDGEAEVTEDTLLGGRVRLRQPRRGHRTGTDAILLAATLVPTDDDVVYDVGAGVGGVGLIIASRSNAALIFVEQDPVIARLCRENVALNGLGERARVIEADILASAEDRRAAGLVAASADVVVTNPPFLDEAQARKSPVRARAAAHHLEEGGLERWIGACCDLLKPKGRLGLIHRAERLGECLGHLGRSFGDLTVRGVHPRSHEAAIRILVTGRKGSGAPMRLLPPLILHEAGGEFTSEAAALHAGGDAPKPKETGARGRPINLSQ